MNRRGQRAHARDNRISSTCRIIATSTPHSLRAGLSGMARRESFRSTLVGKQLWRHCGYGLWSGHGVAPPSPPPSPPPPEPRMERRRSGACSRQCAWARQFPHASYLRNRASGCSPLCKHKPYFQRWRFRAVAEVPFSLSETARSVSSLRRAAGTPGYGDVLVTIFCSYRPHTISVASDRCWEGLASLEARSTEVLDDCGHAGTGQGMVEMGGDGAVMESQQARPGVSRQQPTKWGGIE